MKVKMLLILGTSMFLYNCHDVNREVQSPDPVIELGFSVGYDQDTVRVYNNGILLDSEIVTTNYSVGSAYAIRPKDYGIYKVLVNGLDTLQVNISPEYPFAYVYKDSTYLGIEYFNSFHPAD